jgi:hypothetical protein
LAIRGNRLVIRGHAPAVQMSNPGERIRAR